MVMVAPRPGLYPGGSAPGTCPIFRGVGAKMNRASPLGAGRACRRGSRAGCEAVGMVRDPRPGRVDEGSFVAISRRVCCVRGCKMRGRGEGW